MKDLCLQDCYAVLQVLVFCTSCQKKSSCSWHKSRFWRWRTTIDIWCCSSHHLFMMYLLCEPWDVGLCRPRQRIESKWWYVNPCSWF